MSLYEIISNHYDHLFPLKNSRLSFINSFLSGANLSILDIGCATGELALALSEKGHHVTGIDIDSNMIEIAREKAKNRGLKIQLFSKNMDCVGKDFDPFSFDAVLCFGNTLVHLKSLKKIENFFRNVLKILKNSGVFILQVVNYNRILVEEEANTNTGYSGLPLIENEELTFQRNYFYDEKLHLIRFQGVLTFKETGAKFENSELLYPLTFHQLKISLKNTDFTNIEFFENDYKVPYSVESPGLIACAVKKLFDEN